MNVFAILVVGRWLHLTSVAIVFGAALFPRYAPTGRLLDRPLRIAVRAAAACALITALAETGIARPSLPRLALLAFAGLICVSLRRNSWTARTQGAVLAVVAGLAMASEPFTGASSHGPPWGQLAMQMPALLAMGARLGGLVALYLVVAKASRNGDAKGAIARLAGRRSFVVAALASGLMAAAGIAEASRLLPVQLGLCVGLLGLAAVDLLVCARRMGGSATIALRASLCLQGALTVLLLGTMALAWTTSMAA